VTACGEATRLMRPNVAFGASSAPNVAFGALDATNATLGRTQVCAATARPATRTAGAWAEWLRPNGHLG